MKMISLHIQKLRNQFICLLQILPCYFFSCISGKRFHACKVRTHEFALGLQLTGLTGLSNRTPMLARRDTAPCICRLHAVL